MGFNHTLLAIDVHSRFTWLRPLADKTSKSVAKAFLAIVGDFGPFQILTADNGPEFHNETIQELSKLLNFELRHTSPYNPRANGLAERAIGSTMQIVRKALDGDSPSWPASS